MQITAVLLQGAKIDVLLYNGDLDLSCNPQSTELALESMEWSGKKEWMDPEKTPWQQWMIGKKKTISQCIPPCFDGRSVYV